MRLVFGTYLLLALLSLAATCERPVDLDIQIPPSQLVVNSVFTQGELVKVEVSKSKNILDSSPDEYFINAKVTLFQEETLLEELQLVIDPSERIPPYYSTVAFKPSLGVTYTIKVEVSGYETVMAKSFIPISVPIDVVEVENYEEHTGGSSFSKKFTYALLLDYHDPPGADFYHLNIMQEIRNFGLTEAGDTVFYNSEWRRVPLLLEHPDILQDELVGGLLIKDKPNIALRFPMEVEIVPEFQLVGRVAIELRTLTEEYYLFFSTYNRQRNQVESPFVDQVVIFNNVDNGHGFFVGYNATSDTIRVGD